MFSAEASFCDNDSTTQNSAARGRFKDHLPPTAATWSAALLSSRAKAAAVAAATMATLPSVVSLTLASREEAEEDATPRPVLCGLFKCTPRRLRTCLYLGFMVSFVISIELGLYIWALVRGALYYWSDLSSEND